jgi:hypothetical protein
VVERTRYEQAADRGVRWLTAWLGNDGSYGPEADDLACYYKSPYLFQLSGRARQASQPYAGHTGKSDAGSTTTYIRADLQEVASALAMLTGEPHPLGISDG